MPTKTKTLLGGLSLIVFAALALGVITHAAWLAQLDAAASTLATRAIDPTNTAIFKVVATLGSPATVIGLTALLCLWLWLKQGPVISLWFAGLQLGGSAITEGFKLLIDRSRPLHQLVLDHGASFPSGHTFCTALLVFTLWTLCLPHIQDQESQLITILIGIGWIAMVAISRVYLRDHYLSDVLTSVCLAGGWWLLVTPVQAFIQTKMRQFLPERMLKSWPHQN